ncbi:MAG: CopD family protein [Planctomycetota bacterium]|nr:CopD family protein [Planctomycetota bacterium]
MAIPIALHILASTLWVGGMLFAHLALRPSLAEKLEPPQRLPVWHAVLKRFFGWVWLSVLMLHATGYWMLFGIFGGMKAVGMHVHLMLGLAWVMTILFGILFWGPYARLSKAIGEGDLPAGGAQMGSIRKIVTINLVLGLIVTVVGSAGRYVG